VVAKANDRRLLVGGVTFGLVDFRLDSASFRHSHRRKPALGTTGSRYIAAVVRHSSGKDEISVASAQSAGARRLIGWYETRITAARPLGGSSQKQGTVFV
jgi:hypothetical protein